MNIVELLDNALEVSVTKRLSHGFQFLASYTFSKTLDTDGSDINSISAGNTLTLGNQNSPRERWGRASTDRTHRFVISGTWMLPQPNHGIASTVFGGWFLSGVGIVQSGSVMTIALTNATNVFGISEDRAELTDACSKSQLLTSEPIGKRLESCFTTPPVVGADGIGTAFGNNGTGHVDDPGQVNVDLSLSKLVALPWPREGISLEFRAEFFNTFIHPQFANPDANFSSATLGVITSTAVNARVGQLGLKFSF